MPLSTRKRSARDAKYAMSAISIIKRHPRTRDPRVTFLTQRAPSTRKSSARNAKYARSAMSAISIIKRLLPYAKRLLPYAARQLAKEEAGHEYISRPAHTFYYTIPKFYYTIPKVYYTIPKVTSHLWVHTNPASVYHPHNRCRRDPPSDSPH